MSSADQFTFVPAPTITSVVPSTGPTIGNTLVTINGTNFTGATRVAFATTPGTGLTVVSDTAITVFSPAHGPGTVDVTVFTPGGTNTTSTADQFTFILEPTISLLSPSQGPAAGGTSVTITGTDFTGATAVDFGTAPAAHFTVDSDTQITAVSPPHAAGKVDVSVSNPSATSPSSITDEFTFIAAPTVTLVAPTSGSTAGGTSVTITGTDFTGASAVDFGTTATASLTVVSDTEITTTSPAHAAGTVDVTVTTPGGTSATSSADQFTFVAPSAPGAPTNLSATLGVGEANLSWNAPSSDGGSPITSYTVDITDTTTSTALTPVTVSGSPAPLNADLTGLTPGNAYSFTVTATNAVGMGPTSVALAELLPAPYFPVAPARICDTRSGNATPCSGQTLTAGDVVKVQVTGQGGVPAGATAVVANVTATGASDTSFFTVYPDGSTRPVASNVNFKPEQTVPNLVTVPLSASGAIDIYNAFGEVNAIVDVSGYYGPDPGAGQGFTSLTPARICDTRSGTSTPCTGKTLSAGGTLTVQVTGEGGVPTGASAVVANLTVTGATAPSFLTAFEAGTTRPLASNINFAAGQTVPNRVIIPLSSTGALDLYNAFGEVNAIVDVDGYFSSSVSGYFEPVTPARICDTRASNTTPCAGKTLSAGGTLDVQVTGNGGIQTGAAAVVANATATGPTAASYLTLYPQGGTQPVASDLNFVAGETVPNLVVAKLSSSGGLTVFNAFGSVNAILDVAGWYTG
jgi:hypothetical protein